MSELRNQRDKLNAILYPEALFNDWAIVKWHATRALIDNWWQAYKGWEAKDTFDKAYRSGRMSVRTFGDPFEKIVGRVIKPGELKVDPERFYADGKNKQFGEKELESQRNAYFSEKEFQKYHAVRGIDSSKFANPANFVSREKKYDMGLHDLSASLLNPYVSILEQIHSKSDGAHFSFVPLSKEEDQQVLYTLFRRSKTLAHFRPDLYSMIRTYRASMTRVKLAQDFDMAIGYVAVPSKRQGDGPQFKLRYGLGNTTTVMPQDPKATMPVLPRPLTFAPPQVGPPPGMGSGTGFGPPPPPPPPMTIKETDKSVSVPVTPGIIDERIDNALHFRRLLKREGKNEIVIALREHKGGFPLLAMRDNRVLRCYDISGGKQAPNGKTISEWGIMS